jgi:hypothetical protein
MCRCWLKLAVAATGKARISMKSLEFGFLQEPLKGNFLGVSFEPVDDYTEKLSILKTITNIDGFYYPPEVARYTTDTTIENIKEKIEKSEKPALVYPLFSSHTLSIQHPVSSSNEPCSDAALIIYLMAYIFGTRLQPSEWKFDGRIPFKSNKEFAIHDSTCLHFLENVYRWWRNLKEQQRRKFVNILYVYTRAKSLQWDWDVFIHQYMVFDALYKLHVELQPYKTANNHKARFNILCGEYSVFDDQLITRIYNARNNLFHEAMWIGDSTIGFGSPDSDAYLLPQYLASLNSQIICGITGYKNQYTRTAWWSRQMLLFDRMT